MRKLPDYKYNIGDYIHGTKSTYKVVDRKILMTSKGRTKTYVCECQKCKGIVEHYESAIRNCVYCANKKVLEGYNDIATTNPELVKYFENPDDAKKIYANASRVQINAKCPFCGFKRKITPVALTLSGKLACPQCGSSNSYPNKLGLSFLKQLPIINLETEYSPEWSGYYRYDFSFYYNDVHYLMEMDGGFHYDKSRFKPLDEIQKNDRNKDELANINNCVLIRIECKKSNLEYIKKNIESSLLSSIFDLSNIDWKKCEKACAKNLTKEICDYYNSTKNIDATANHFYMCRSTIITYLKRGSKIGWTDYQTHFETQYKNIIHAVELKKNNPDLGRSEIAKLLGVSCTTATNYLEKAKKMGLIDNINDSHQIRKEKIIEILKQNPNTPIYQLEKTSGYCHTTLSKYRRMLNESMSA